ncbi:immunity protein YezG family protein [Oceanobacillus kimchii]|uniref:immunity protein YezG family protein n=1 Tax=Oceanobacillus kimchii TaxID=746691 RepID=UPI0009869F1D|nr:immunity protein YezG family protein [Oceanobacillus kimchii]
MSFETKLNKLYNQIAQKINEMIPIEWDSFSFNGEVKDEEGGVFFFFKPKDEKQHIYSHYIPKIYNVDKRYYNRELHQLFELTVDLQKAFINNDQEPWFSVTLLVNNIGKLNVHFDYTNWHNSDFGPSDRIQYFEYKYLDKNKEQVDLDLIEKMKKFEN